MDIVDVHRRTVEAWRRRVAAVDGTQWDLPTPCAEWSVRDLVNHVVGEDRWTKPLLDGRTIADVGDSFDGDLLGSAPWEEADAAADEALASAAEQGPAGGKVHLSYGEEDMAEYLWQLAADHLVHAWDLAVATDGDRVLDAELVDHVGGWFADREELYRSAGLVGPSGPRSVDPQSELLARFGRDVDWGPNHVAMTHFAAAFGRGDVDGIMALMTDDCVFEATGPAPEGTRYEGSAAVRAVWEELFGGTPDAAFTTEESLVSGDRALLRWRFTWTNADGTPGHVRGVDVLRLRHGKVAEKFSYVKG